MTENQSMEWNKFVPSMVQITKSGATTVLKELVGYLESEGKCPSVLGAYNSLSEILSNVTLEEHSFNVTLLMLAKFKRQMASKQFEFLSGVPEVVFSGLGHDAGKLRIFAGPPIGRYDHAWVGADFLRDLFRKHRCSPPWLSRVLSAIRSHHSDYTPKEADNLVKLLREADWEARKKEVEVVRSRSNAQSEK